ncbi:MAG TPA: hypothetical protein VEW95_09400 [Candidatus Limnocylindrales bacterium]|nr:hypothetical protein [Candidatus Limnocylindrales bacterium]
MVTSLRPVTYRAQAWNVEDADGRIYLELVSGLNETPEMRGEDQPTLSGSGRFARNHVPDIRSIELRGWAEGYGTDNPERAEHFRTKIKLIQLWFDPSVFGELSVTLEDGTTATINARTDNLLTEQLIGWKARVSIELESIDPNWVIA